MKKIYLLLSILGFALPNYYTIKVSIETGNILYWTKPVETISGMFANDIAAGFILDLLPAVMVFFVWSYRESKRLQIPRLWLYWSLSLLFGIAGPFPLFLYVRENYLKQNE